MPITPMSQSVVSPQSSNQSQQLLVGMEVGARIGNLQAEIQLSFQKKVDELWQELHQMKNMIADLQKKLSN